jgi:hypothetical protein
MIERVSDGAASRIARAVDIGVIILVAVWHLGYDTMKLVISWPQYDPAALEVACWCGFTALNVVGSIALLRGWRGTWSARGLALCVLAMGTAATAACPAGEAIGDPSWAWNSVGWFSVLVLLHRPVWELTVVLAGNILITGAFLAADHALDRRMTVQFATVICTTAGIQLLFVLAGNLLHRTATQATEAAAAATQTLAHSRAAEEVHVYRQERYEFLRRHVVPLLRGLAEGQIDPADPVAHRRCAIEAGRIRRLFTETDQGPDPLVRELLACADIAERRHVQVDLVTIGEVPPLPVTVRRELTDAPLALLAMAATTARITVVAGHDEVAVSVLADTTDDVPPDRAHTPSISSDWHREGDNLWVQTRWNAPSPSASSTITPSSSKGSTTGWQQSPA